MVRRCWENGMKSLVVTPLFVCASNARKKLGLESSVPPYASSQSTGNLTKSNPCLPIYRAPSQKAPAGGKEN